MQVDNIQIGTVIDHIPSGKAMVLVKFLGVESVSAYRIAIVLNVPSKKMGTKDILKLEGRFLTEKEAGVVSLICPDATINLIKNSKVAEKLNPKTPNLLEFLVSCPNQECIHSDRPTLLDSVSKDKYRCRYCEKVFGFSELF
ncbi:MAG: aspartate carbamoyltransferase regulatory subunit [Candidatus Bilamarchaeum sp.]|jgi:aspartate carbamoyltransferase regulatory subunit